MSDSTAKSCGVRWVCEKVYDKSESGEFAIQLNVPPDLRTLINKRLSSGGYGNVEDVLRRALEARDAEESWTGEERGALMAISRKDMFRQRRTR